MEPDPLPGWIGLSPVSRETRRGRRPQSSADPMAAQPCLRSLAQSPHLAFQKGAGGLLPGAMHIGWEVSCCLSSDSCREAAGSSLALPRGLGLYASQVLMATQLWAKPLPRWALGKRTPHYHLLLPQFTLCAGHAGIPLSTVGAAQCWQEALPTGHQKPLAVPFFRRSLDGKKGLGRTCWRRELPIRNCRPCPADPALAEEQQRQ